MNEEREITNAQPHIARNPAVPIPPPPLPPADGSAEAIAGYIVALLDYIESLVPDFQPYDKNAARRVAAAARFAKPLIPPTIDAVTSNARVADVNIFDVERGRGALDFSTAMTLVARRMSALLDGVVFTVDSVLARAGAQALATYAWARKHVKGSDGIELRPYVDQMSLAIKTKMNRRKTRASTPVPEPSPAPAPNVVARTGGDEDLPGELREPSTTT